MASTPVLWFSGFPGQSVKDLTKIILGDIPYTALVESDYFHDVNFYAMHGVAAVELEKRVIAGCSIAIIDLDDAAVEPVCQMMFASAVERIVLGVTAQSVPGGWVTSHCMGIFPNVTNALTYAKSLLEAQQKLEVGV